MTDKPKMCIAIEPDLIAHATGEATRPAAAKVEEHVGRCASCRDDFTRYRAIDSTVGTLRTEPATGDAEAARQRLVERLADLRTRLVGYRVFPSPLGSILIATSEHGVALVEYLPRGGVQASRLFRMAGVEPQEGGPGLERLHGELLEFLGGRRTRLDWPLDLRGARSDFERRVLEATSAVPYGAVSSYTGIAGDIGQPSAVRAVAQALRHNPLPIVIPCHRIVGVRGDLVGYAGDRLNLKERLLGVEGVPTERTRIARRAMYHYDPNPSHQYCLPTCGDIAKRPLGVVRLFARREQAREAGLDPCLDCRPDLYPLAS